MGAYDCDCINNLEYDRRRRKAQLSHEGTTSDTISRKAALEKVRTMQTYKLFMGDDMILVDRAEVQTGLMMLPPAQPKVIIGHWIQYDKRFPWRHHYKCSVCGNYLDFSGVNGGRGEVNFCPKCGTKMKGERQK